MVDEGSAVVCGLQICDSWVYGLWACRAPEGSIVRRCLRSPEFFSMQVCLLADLCAGRSSLAGFCHGRLLQTAACLSVGLPSARLNPDGLVFSDFRHVGFPADGLRSGRSPPAGFCHGRFPNCRLPSVGVLSTRLKSDGLRSLNFCHAGFPADGLLSGRSPPAGFCQGRFPNCRLPSVGLPSARLNADGFWLVSDFRHAGFPADGLRSGRSPLAGFCHGRFPNSRLPSVGLPSVRLNADGLRSFDSRHAGFPADDRCSAGPNSAGLSSGRFSLAGFGAIRSFESTVAGFAHSGLRHSGLRSSGLRSSALRGAGWPSSASFSPASSTGASGR